MGNMKIGKLLQTFFILFLCIAKIPEIVSSYQSPQKTSPEKQEETGFNLSSCFLNVIPIKYEINIDPIQVASLNLSRNSSDINENKAVVSAWEKIIVQIAGYNEDNCSNGSLIKINTRDCTIHIEAVNITKVNSNSSTEQIQILNRYFDMDNLTNNSPVTQFVIQLEDFPFSSGDLLELYIPYQFELEGQHPAFYDPDGLDRHDLYYYDASGFNCGIYDNVHRYHPMTAKFIFPTLDNPDPLHKQRIQLNVARSEDDGFISISNMDILETFAISGKEGRVKDSFRESIPIRLDQVSLMILRGFQNFTVVGNNTQNNSLTVNLWAFKYESFESLYGGKSAVGSAKEIFKLLNWFEIKLNRTYPLNKLDFVALPRYSSLGPFRANFGVVAGSEDGMLAWPSQASQVLERVKRTHNVLRTGVTSQWFPGMIGTGLSTKGLYNNQDPLIVDRGLPRYVANWVIEDSDISLYRDFDQGWEPGKKAFEVMESVFSRRVMQSAIIDFYLPTTAVQKAQPVDFYEAMHQAIIFHNVTHLLPAENVTVRDLLRTWTNKHHRSLAVIITEDKSNVSCISIYQQITPSANDPSELWWVPVKVLTEKGEHTVWLSPNNTSTNTSVIWCNPAIDTMNNWLFTHVGYTPLYPVRYSDSLVKNLISQLNINHTVIPAVGRVYLLENHFNFRNPVLEKFTKAFGLSEYLGNETDFNVWSLVVDFIIDIPPHFIDRSASLQEFFSPKINAALKKIGMRATRGESNTYPALRYKFMEVCGWYEVPVGLDYATEIVTGWINDTYQNSSDLISKEDGLYCAALRSPSEDLNDNAAFHFMLEQIFNQKDSNKNFFSTIQICAALACVKNDSVFVSLLNNEKFTSSNNTILQKCFNTFISELLMKRPVMGEQVVFDYRMRQTLSGHIKPETFLDYLSTQSGMIAGVKEKVLMFLNDHQELFPALLAERVKSITNKLTARTSQEDDLWEENGVVRKLDAWFKANF